VPSCKTASGDAGAGAAAGPESEKAGTPYARSISSGAAGLPQPPPAAGGVTGLTTPTVAAPWRSGMATECPDGLTASLAAGPRQPTASSVARPTTTSRRVSSTAIVRVLPNPM
jgi:hypothetical protein